MKFRANNDHQSQEPTLLLSPALHLRTSLHLLKYPCQTKDKLQDRALQNTSANLARAAGAMNNKRSNVLVEVLLYQPLICIFSV